MELLEIAEKHRLSREQAAALLHSVADSLARHNDVEFTREGKILRIDVPSQVTVEVEVEIESDESSLEIEIKW